MRQNQEVKGETKEGIKQNSRYSASPQYGICYTTDLTFYVVSVLPPVEGECDEKDRIGRSEQ